MTRAREGSISALASVRPPMTAATSGDPEPKPLHQAASEFLTHETVR